jgi:hypothetical protein
MALNASDISGSGQNFKSDVQNGTLAYAYSSNLKADDAPFIGTKSIFNEYAIFRLESSAGNYNMLYDKEGSSGITPFYSRNPSATNIIAWSQEQHSGYSPFGSAPYSFSDFLYCKYHAEIPNNYLVTLRRFPIPMVDNLKTQDGNNIPPLAQAVTWFGSETGNSLKDIMKFTFGLQWKELEASVQEVIGNERGFDDGALNGVAGGGAVKSALAFLNPNEYSGLAQSQSDYAQQQYGENGPYANKVYGPVNVIHKTMLRDRGMHFEGDISLNFHYSLKTIGNINPKAAMLDLISNILVLTYNNAKFWGGAIRYFPQYPRVRQFGDQKKFYSGDIDGYISSLSSEFGKLADTFMKQLSSLLENPLQALQELAKGGGKMFLANKAAQNRPQILAMRSLLTGDPVGEWHLVVGNPMNPIAMIGNLICTDVEFEFNDELGNDDFPTELKVNIKLKHGKPRDAGDIQSMFNLGNGRTYYGIQDSAFSSAHNSIVDTSGTKGNKDKSQGNADTAANIASKTNNSNSSATKSMWGNAYKKSEYDLTKTWAGSAPPPPAQAAKK